MNLKYLGKRNILLVEDDHFNVQLIKSYLSKISDINIITAEEGLQALNILELGKDDIDMVLLDLHMKGMDGKDTLHYIRKNKKFDELPILIVSVDGMDENVLRSMGASDFILKPYDIEELAFKISAHSKYKQ